MTVLAHVLFFGPHVEKVVVLPTSEGVVSIFTDDRLVFLRRLDVPEVVLGDGSENLGFRAGS